MRRFENNIKIYRKELGCGLDCCASIEGLESSCYVNKITNA